MVRLKLWTFASPTEEGGMTNFQIGQGFGNDALERSIASLPRSTRAFV